MHHSNPAIKLLHLWALSLSFSYQRLQFFISHSLMRTLVADESDIYLDMTVTHCTNNGRDSRPGEPIPTVKSLILDDYTQHPKFIDFQENCTLEGCHNLVLWPLETTNTTINTIYYNVRFEIGASQDIRRSISPNAWVLKGDGNCQPLTWL